MAHTPGPWRNDTDGCIYAHEPSVNAEILVCEMNPGEGALTEFDIDNAKLIAAAPKMLAALEQVIKDIPGVLRSEEMNYVQQVVDEAKGE